MRGVIFRVHLKNNSKQSAVDRDNNVSRSLALLFMTGERFKTQSHCDVTGEPSKLHAERSALVCFHHRCTPPFFGRVVGA
jgi:hypothetical protein